MMGMVAYFLEALILAPIGEGSKPSTYPELDRNICDQILPTLSATGALSSLEIAQGQELIGVVVSVEMLRQDSMPILNITRVFPQAFHVLSRLSSPVYGMMGLRL